MVSSLALVVCIASLAQAAVKLSDFVSPCSIKDPKIDECLKTQAQAIIPHFVKGSRDWGILPVDPLVVPHTTIQKAGSDSRGFSFNITDSTHMGWKNVQIKDFKFDAKNYEFTIDMFFPTYIVKGTYVVGGQIILLPIRGDGLATITFKDTAATSKMSCKPETSGKETYLKIVKSSVDLSPKGIVFDLDNLFGNKALSDNMNTVLTDNSLEVFRDLKESFDNVFSDIIEAIVSRMLKKVPLNQLFKDV